MTDTKTDAERSRNMSAVKSKNTRPEVLLRKAVWRRGLRFFTSQGWKQLTGTKPAGSPDLIFPRAKLAVFVDGCFWHGCPQHYSEPDDNRDFWRRKLEKNQARDRVVNDELAAKGWRVLRFWEHELRKGGLERVAQAIAMAVNSLSEAAPGRLRDDK